MSNIDPDPWRAASNALRSVDRATGRPALIAVRFFSLARIGVVMLDAASREVSATSFQRGQMKNARSFFFDIPDCSSAIIVVRRARLSKQRQRLREICYFTSARKLGVGSAPMSACLDAFAAILGVPAEAPWIAGNWRVTCAVY